MAAMRIPPNAQNRPKKPGNIAVPGSRGRPMRVPSSPLIRHMQRRYKLVRAVPTDFAAGAATVPTWDAFGGIFMGPAEAEAPKPDVRDRLFYLRPTRRPESLRVSAVSADC